MENLAKLYLPICSASSIRLVCTVFSLHPIPQLPSFEKNFMTAGINQLFMGYVKIIDIIYTRLSELLIARLSVIKHN
jgi:hypothetical protein